MLRGAVFFAVTGFTKECQVVLWSGTYRSRDTWEYAGSRELDFCQLECLEFATKLALHESLPLTSVDNTRMAPTTASSSM